MAGCQVEMCRFHPKWRVRDWSSWITPETWRPNTRMSALFSVAEIGERTFETFRKKGREKILQQLLHQACGEKLPSRAFQLYDGFCGNKLLLHVHERWAFFMPTIQPTSPTPKSSLVIPQIQLGKNYDLPRRKRRWIKHAKSQSLFKKMAWLQDDWNNFGKMNQFKDFVPAFCQWKAWDWRSVLQMEVPRTTIIPLQIHQEEQILWFVLIVLFAKI